MRCLGAIYGSHARDERVAQDCGQALSRLKPGPVKADAPKVVLPDREAMKNHMDALIHHFLIVAEGFDVPPGEVLSPDRGVERRAGCLHEIEWWA